MITRSITHSLKDKEGHFMLTYAAPPIHGKPLPAKSFIFVFDCSTSMEGTKIEQCRQLYSRSAKLFRDIDEVAVVSYSDDANVVCDWTKCDLEGKAKLEKAFNNLMPNGCTNLSGGLFQAISMTKDRPDATIVMCTDGIANRGVTDVTNFESLVKKLVADTNISIFTLGIGDDHQSDMLIKCSINGMYSYAKTDEETTSAFANIMGASFSTYFQNVEFTVSGENVYLTDTNDKPVDVIRVGDVMAEENKNLLLKMKCSGNGPSKVFCKIRAMNLLTGKQEETQETYLFDSVDKKPCGILEARMKILEGIEELKKIRKLKQEGRHKEAETSYRCLHPDVVTALRMPIPNVTRATSMPEIDSVIQSHQLERDTSSGYNRMSNYRTPYRSMVTRMVAEQ